LAQGRGLGHERAFGEPGCPASCTRGTDACRLRDENRLNPCRDVIYEGTRYNLPIVDTALPAGSLFAGRYRIDHPIGQGERKQTYVAWDTRARRRVALAVMVAGADPRATEREVEMLGRVCPHANIVTLHEVGLDAEPAYLVFEYLAGGELRDYCRSLQSQAQLLPLPEFFRTARQLCRALARVHGRGIIHRDVSATNIWLDERGEAHLGDFDTATSLDEPFPSDGGSSTTEGCAAPELLSGAAVDARADLYSLGAVLYELLTGSGPALAAKPAEVAAPSKSRDDVPPRLDRLIQSMLATEREARPENAQAVLDELRDIEKTADLDSLIPNGESTSLEFKQTMWWDTVQHKRNKDLLRGCVKTVCAFLNGDGGTLLIGVANSGEPTGLEDDLRDFSENRTVDGFELRFRDALVAGIEPEASHLVMLSFPSVRGIQICRVDVQRSPHPVFLVGKNVPPEFYVRKGNASRPLDVRQAHEYICDRWG
jgi:serine/threonine protein kinase